MDERMLLARSVIQAYARGALLHDAYEAVGMDGNEFYRILRKNPELQALREEAREPHAQAMLPRMIQASDDEDGKRARNRIGVLQWIAERAAPNEFGQRTTVTHEGTINLLGPRIDAAAAVLDAPSDYLTAEQRAQAIDVPTSHALASPDRLSGAQPAKANAVDIFEE